MPFSEQDGWKQASSMGEMWEFTLVPTVRGVYFNKKEHVGENDSNIYVLKQEDGSEIGVWGSTLLDSRFGGIKLGEEVGVEFLGKKKSLKGGREYNDFNLFHREVPMRKVEDIKPEEIPY